MYRDKNMMAESVTDFIHPAPSVRRKIWYDLTGEKNHVPPPYLPSVSSRMKTDINIYHFKGSIISFDHVEGCVGYRTEENEVALCDGKKGAIFTLDDTSNLATLKSITNLRFKGQCKETSRGISGLTEDGEVLAWPYRSPYDTSAIAEMSSEAYTYIGRGAFIHNSLTNVFTEDDTLTVKEWNSSGKEPDMREGVAMVTHYMQNKNLIIMDATMPSRKMRVIAHDTELNCLKRLPLAYLTPRAEYTPSDPYNNHIEYNYHTPLYVTGRAYAIDDKLSLCIGTSRFNFSIEEVYGVTNEAIWSRLSNYNEPGVQRRLVAADTVVSFYFQPYIGWAVKNFIHFT